MRTTDCLQQRSLLMRFILVVAVVTFSTTVIVMKTDVQPLPKVEQNMTNKCQKLLRAHPDNRKVSSYWHISRTNKQYLEYIQDVCLVEASSKSNTQQLCPCIPDHLEGISVTPSQYVHTWLMVKDKLITEPLSMSGYWSPHHCQPRRKVAILIPFADREEHLMSFLAHNVNIWQKQLIEFRIFVVEQREPDLFNKGALMNAGYLEIKKRYDFDCLLLHDVDMLMENELNIVHCGDHVVHHGAYVNKMRYRLIYFSIFGGAICLKPELFEKINGYSNQFFGWGGEDDNFFQRVRLSCSSWFRAPASIARFHMIRHKRDKKNPVNKHAWHQVWKESKQTYLNDGLNTIQYVVKAVENRPFFTWILLDLLPPEAAEQSQTNKSPVTEVSS